MKQKRLAALMLALILIAPTMAMAAETSASGSLRSNSSYVSGLMDKFPQLLGGNASNSPLNAPTDAENTENAAKVDEGIEKANNWFKETTGLGLDQLVRAAWKLLVWLTKEAIKWGWAIVAWVTETVGAK